MSNDRTNTTVQGAYDALKNRHDYIENQASGTPRSFAQNDLKFDLPNNSIDDHCIQFAGSCSASFAIAANPIDAFHAQYTIIKDTNEKTVDGQNMDDYNGQGFAEYQNRAINPDLITDVEAILKNGGATGHSAEQLATIQAELNEVVAEPEKFGLKFEDGWLSDEYVVTDPQGSYDANQIPKFTQ